MHFVEVFSKGSPLAFGNGTDFFSFPAAHRVLWWLFLLHAEQCVVFFFFQGPFAAPGFWRHRLAVLWLCTQSLLASNHIGDSTASNVGWKPACSLTQLVPEQSCRWRAPSPEVSPPPLFPAPAPLEPELYFSQSNQGQTSCMDHCLHPFRHHLLPSSHTPSLCLTKFHVPLWVLLFSVL